MLLEMGRVGGVAAAGKGVMRLIHGPHQHNGSEHP